MVALCQQGFYIHFELNLGCCLASVTAALLNSTSYTIFPLLEKITMQLINLSFKIDSGF